jgi:hypothetical protein
MPPKVTPVTFSWAANPIVAICETNKIHQELLFHHKWTSKDLVVSNDQANQDISKPQEKLGSTSGNLLNSTNNSSMEVIPVSTN